MQKHALDSIMLLVIVKKESALLKFTWSQIHNLWACEFLVNVLTPSQLN